ncbi:hypothetical protein ACGYU5_15250 [Burkholderia pseudomallei]
MNYTQTEREVVKFWLAFAEKYAGPARLTGGDTPKVMGYSIDDAMDGSPCMYGTWVIQSDGSLKLLEYGPTPGLNWPCSEKLDPIGDTQ